MSSDGGGVTAALLDIFIHGRAAASILWLIDQVENQGEIVL